MQPSRREILKAAALVALAPAAALRARAQVVSPDPWSAVPEILARIAPPRFPARDFDITRYGAARGGAADGSAAILAAIEACSAAGGGRVVVPDGTFLTGPIRLRSRVALHLSEGATLKFATDPSRYLPPVFTRYEGMELMGYSPLISCLDAEDVAITGSGTLDGQADRAHWWDLLTARQAGLSSLGDSRRRLMDMVARATPVADRIFAEGSPLRPQFIQPYRSRNVLIEGITIVNSPMWEIHPVLCTNVVVRGVTIRSHGPNNDGCNPESCRDVLIERCSFDTGDDCIALKSGRNDDGRRIGVPVENVIVRDCTMKDGHGGVTIGSEISGGARNVFAERCRMDSPDLDRALRIKTNAIRGGIVEKVYMREVTIGEVKEAIVHVDFNYEEGDKGSYTPIVRDIDVRNVTSRTSAMGLFLRGYERSPISNVHLTDCTFENVAKGDVLEHVRDLTLTNVTVNGRTTNQTISR
ncbi:MAG TPA: glycoside hydrolase family 28 protein [Vicinamibacterales bacterium]|nr:glycoside hydrolase family 28 protein [Vicinamibacterales bacterium]